MPTKWRIVAAITVLIVLAGGVAWLVWPGRQQATVNGKVNVVAAENFWGDIAVQLGGNHVHVTSIITDPNADPHLYESSAQNASAVAGAQVIIVNGLGYDDFMTKLLSASPNAERTVLTAADILSAPEGSNQHLWYNIPNVPKVASKITDAYIAKDPAHKADYQHNLAVFDDSLQSLNHTIAQIKQKYAGTPVAYTEPVPGYLLQAAGLDVKTPEGFAKSIEDGDDPSPADANAMDTLMTTKAVKVLLYNAQATSPVTEHVKDLAKQAGIPVIGVTETLPPSEKSYQSWQQSQMNELLRALGA
jgi:zinc/manganese transport system substrate-binding protein